MSDHVLEAHGVTVHYGTFQALENFTMTFSKGCMCGLIGPNGAGKSTALRALSGIVTPSSGRVVLHGADAQSLSAAERARQVAFVPQFTPTAVPFSVYDYVSLGRTPYLSSLQCPGKTDREFIRRAMEQTDTLHLEHRWVNELSSGEAQRVVLARGLAQQTKVLLMDEPTAHLDVKHAWEIMALAHRLRLEVGLSVIMATHDLNLAAAYCDEVVLLREGGKVHCGGVDEVMTNSHLSSAYDYPMRVLPSGDGSILVVPQRPSKRAAD